MEKSRACSSRCCGQLFVGRVGNKGNDINWDASPVSSPATVLTHCGEVNKVNWIQNITSLSRNLSHSLQITVCLSGTFYDTRDELLQGLKSGELDGALKDVFTVNSLIKDLNDSEFEVSKTVSKSFYYGIELTGEARHLLKDFQEYLRQNPFLAFLDSSSSETTPTDTPTVSDKEEAIEFFDPENSLYQQAVKVTALVLVVLATSGVIYQIRMWLLKSRKGKI